MDPKWRRSAGGGRVGIAFFMMIGLVGATGCGGSARYVKTGGTERVLSVGQVDIGDFTMAAQEMVQSLLASAAIRTTGNRPAVLAVSRVINDTSTYFDVEQITRRIRIALSQTGQVQTITTYGGITEDPIAREQRERAAFQAGTAVSNKVDYTLSGKILEHGTRDGRTREQTYTFMLALTDTRTGLAVWEDLKDVTKQQTKPLVGW